MAPSRVFLGWDAPLLSLAADWLQRERGAALPEHVVVVPGRRAARRLEEILLARGQKEPPGRGVLLPEVLTAGAFSDRLLRLARPVAPRLLRTLVWAEALGALPADQRAVLCPGDGATLPARLLAAESIRTLHAELQEAGVDFARAAQALPAPVPADLAQRWQVLAALQPRFVARLAQLGYDDPHAGRNAALAAGQLDRQPPVVLIGVVELGGIQRRLLTALGRQATALVFAPPAQAGAFDELGCVRTAAWLDAELPLAADQWTVADKPADQAAAAVATLARWSRSKPLPPDQIVVGVPDAEVVPFLEQALRAQGARPRSAGGVPMDRTGPWRLLHAVAAYVAAPRYAELARLVREPDLEARLRDEPAQQGRGPAEWLDRNFPEHLPDRDLHSLAPVPALVDRLLGPLRESQRRPLRSWAEPLAAFLRRVYATVPLRAEREPERRIGAALEQLGATLRTLAGLPAELDQSTAAEAAAALQLILRASRAEAVAPAADPGAIELLGWLELLHDDGQALVLTGVNEGHVPETARGSPLLDPGQRAALGLPDRDARAARDLYVLHALLRSRPHLHVVCGRRSQVGDPLLPSRVLFAGSDATARQRLAHALRRRATPTVPPGPPAVPQDLPRQAPLPVLTGLSVTAFRRYLESPYGFYLEHVLKLRSVDDAARELDARGFGSLLHDVLHRFGQSEVRDSTDAAQVHASLLRHLDAIAAQAYGAQPRPAVQLQLEQIRGRLRAFAEWQAQRAQAGWRIRHTEWQQDGVAFAVDGEPFQLKGRIDRIDWHPRLGYAILDYKTGDGARPPEETHRRAGAWVDLQLPLYRKLVEPLQLAGTVALGYVHLPRSGQKQGEAMATWDEATLQGAFAAAAEVVRRIRRGEFFTLGSRPPEDPILAAICGQGLLTAAVDPGEAGGAEVEP